jgi:hypothetical protein
MRRNRLLQALLVVALLATGVLFAQQMPKKNISGKRHPNLAMAQTLCERAFNRIQMARKANEYDMNGHAQKAEELLDQADRELKLAAETANIPK